MYINFCIHSRSSDTPTPTHPPASSLSQVPPTQPSPPSTTSGTRNQPGAQSLTSKRVKLLQQHTKLFLLEQAEKRLTSLCSDTETKLELRIRAYLELAKVSSALHHSTTAVQLNLAAMRLLQNAQTTDRGELCHLDVQLWLECRSRLAQSLCGTHLFDLTQSEMLVCDRQCDEGVKECESYGDIELAAELCYVGALHAMSEVPPMLDVVVDKAQVCV